MGVASPDISSAQDPWWAEATAHWGALHRKPVANPDVWYRVGDGLFVLRSDDATLNTRMQQLYGDCACGPPDPGDTAPRLRCELRLAAPFALATFDDPEPLDPIAFALTVFPDRGYIEHPAPAQGWRLFGAEPQFAFTGPHLLADRRTPWQGFVGNLAVNRLLRLQHDVVFFHAAAACIGDRAVLLMGPKGSGKTTLSLALAALGHAFLGDELIGVRLSSSELVPVRRSATIKPGPAAAVVTEKLAQVPSVAEQFPDGGIRRRVSTSRLFPSAPPSPPPHRLAAIVFLEPFTRAAHLERLRGSRDDVRRLTPLACSLWGMRPERRVLALASLVGRVPSYLVRPGPPEATAALIAQSVEE